MRENHYEDEEIKYDSARAPDLDEYQLSPVNRQQQEKTASIDEQLKDKLDSESGPESGSESGDK